MCEQGTGSIACGLCDFTPQGCEQRRTVEPGRSPPTSVVSHTPSLTVCHGIGRFWGSVHGQGSEHALHRGVQAHPVLSSWGVEQACFRCGDLKLGLNIQGHTKAIDNGNCSRVQRRNDIYAYMYVCVSS